MAHANTSRLGPQVSGSTRAGIALGDRLDNTGSAKTFGSRCAAATARKTGVPGEMV